MLGIKTEVNPQQIIAKKIALKKKLTSINLKSKKQ